jgi:hypothetical protein
MGNLFYSKPTQSIEDKRLLTNDIYTIINYLNLIDLISLSCVVNIYSHMYISQNIKTSQSDDEQVYSILFIEQILEELFYNTESIIVGLGDVNHVNNLLKRIYSTSV